MEIQTHPPNQVAMDTETLRKECIEMVKQIEDVRFLRVLHAFMQAWEREYGDPVVGYEADGTAVRASVAKAQFAEDLSKPEEFMTIEEFERELETEATA